MLGAVVVKQQFDVWCGCEGVFVVVLLVVFDDVGRVEEDGEVKSMMTASPTSSTHFKLPKSLT